MNMLMIIVSSPQLYIDIFYFAIRTAAPAAATAAGSDAPVGRQRRCGSDFGRPHSRPGEAQADPAAAGPAASCTQVPATRAGQRGGAGLLPASLPHHEERPQPHDALPGRQILPG